VAIERSLPPADPDPAPGLPPLGPAEPEDEIEVEGCR
jgi:hypothetical protein